MTIGTILTASAARLPDKTAIIADDVRMTFRELDNAANRLANGLIANGVRPGDRVAVISGNRPEYAVAMFGIARAGAVSAHLSPRYTAEEAAHGLGLVKPSMVIAGPGLEMALPTEPIVFGSDAWDALVDGNPTSPPNVVVSDDDPATITFTGGTTGLPKGAVHSHAARAWWCKVACHDFNLTEQEIGLVAAPLFHAAGGFIWFLPMMSTGATAVLVPGWDVPAVIAEIERTKTTGAFLVPAQIAMLLDHPAFDATRLASLTKIMYGAAPAPGALLARAEAALPHVDFFQNFGQTETGPLITLTPEMRKSHPEALGLPSPHVTAAVLDDEGAPVPPGEVGEIAAKGVHVMTGYLDNPDETADFFRSGDGWGRTGDLARVDGDGIITLVDRRKDMIISGGENIYPVEIERILAGHPDVADCAIVGLPDDTWGELPAAAVVLRDGADEAPDALIDFCLDKLARFKRPREVVFFDGLPRTHAGKVLRPELRRQVHNRLGVEPGD